jgi:hypothetical protein
LEDEIFGTEQGNFAIDGTRRQSSRWQKISSLDGLGEEGCMIFTFWTAETRDTSFTARITVAECKVSVFSQNPTIYLFLSPSLNIKAAAMSLKYTLEEVLCNLLRVDPDVMRRQVSQVPTGRFPIVDMYKAQVLQTPLPRTPQPNFTGQLGEVILHKIQRSGDIEHANISNDHSLSLKHDGLFAGDNESEL